MRNSVRLICTGRRTTQRLNGHSPNTGAALLSPFYVVGRMVCDSKQKDECGTYLCIYVLVGSV